MLWDASNITGYEVEASDGRIGTVSDLLFEDEGWVVRWVVVDVGHWLTGRKVLLPRSVLGPPDPALRRLPVKLTLRQVEDGPDVDTEQPVSEQIEAKLDHYYSRISCAAGLQAPATKTMNLAFVEPAPSAGARSADLESADAEPDAPGDPHLRSIVAVTGYYVQATDGEIGHVESFLVDDSDWRIRYLAIDTRNWWPGEKVLISPRSVQEIDWVHTAIHVDIDRKKIKGGPRYDPAITVDGAYDEKFLTYYGIKWVEK